MSATIFWTRVLILLERRPFDLLQFMFDEGEGCYEVTTVHKVPYVAARSRAPAYSRLQGAARATLGLNQAATGIKKNASHHHTSECVRRMMFPRSSLVIQPTFSSSMTRTCMTRTSRIWFRLKLPIQLRRLAAAESGDYWEGVESATIVISFSAQYVQKIVQFRLVVRLMWSRPFACFLSSYDTLAKNCMTFSFEERIPVDGDCGRISTVWGPGYQWNGSLMSIQALFVKYVKFFQRLAFG